MTDRGSYPVTTPRMGHAFTDTAALERTSSGRMARVLGRYGAVGIALALRPLAALGGGRAFGIAGSLRIAAAFFLAAVLISPVAAPWFAEIPGGDNSRTRAPLTGPGGMPAGLGARGGMPAGPAAQEGRSTGPAARDDGPSGQAADARRREHGREMAARMRERARPLYPREEWWPVEMGPRRLGQVPLAEARSPHTLVLPAGKGSFDTREGGPAVAPGLARRPNAPPRARGRYYIAQLAEDAVRGKTTYAVRERIAALGAEILDYVPNNAYVLRVRARDRQRLYASDLFQYVEAYHPAFKIDPRVGIRPLLSPERAAADELKLVVRLHRGEESAGVEDAVRRHGGSIDHIQSFDGRAILAVTLDKHRVFDLARLEEVALIQEKADLAGLSWWTSVQTEMGRPVDPRLTGGFVRPFYDEGIDGGGEYVTQAGQIPGCTPFDPNTGTVDPGCYVVPPQFVGLVDNGISLDAAPLAHSRTEPCAAPGADCSSLVTGVGVGPAHRKVEAYVTSRDVNHDGTPEDATAEGDFLSCDAIASGGNSHGHSVASTMLGNPSHGAFGLGFTYDDTDNSNMYAIYFNDENETEIPMDGQAPGARLLFIDAHGTGTPVVGPPPCATNFLSDVDAGAAVIDEVEALVYRRDLDLSSSTLHERGARVVVLPFGSPAEFDLNVYNGHGTYAGDAEEIDRLLFANRRLTVVVPVGNDGAAIIDYVGVDPFGDKRDPYIPTDPNDGILPDPLLDPEDLQIQDLATGKNSVTVGANHAETNRGLDETEIIGVFSSKGPATLNSLRMAPLVVAPGVESTFGSGWVGGNREGNWFDEYFVSHAAITSFDDEQDTVEGIEQVREQSNWGTSFSAAKVGGAAAQIRDYFAKGYYPAGARDPARRIGDVSGALVKAVLVASTDFAQDSAFLIDNCQNKFCIEQGYGKVELANALPLDSYPATRRPDDPYNLEYQPDVPANILVADEYFDGGLGFGVVELGGITEFPFEVVHGGGSVRVALAWHDAPGETLVNDLDLEVIDGDFDRTPGWDVAWGMPDPGTGMCTASAWVGYGGPWPWTCGYCTIPALSNPDPNWFDPHGTNPYVRRYLGNHFEDRQQFSVAAQCDPNTGALDVTDPDSLRDTDNPTEMVYLYHTKDWGIGLPEVQGTNSEGFYKAVVSFPDTGIQVGAPDTPCVVPAPGSLVLDATTPGGNDMVLSTADGLQYVASGADDPNTTGVDEARCDTTAAGTDVQLVSNGRVGQPFGLVVTGPIAYGGSGRSHVGLDRPRYDCSEASLRITVTEEDPSVSNIATQISAGTVLDVLDPSGLIVDSEAGIGFAPVQTPNVRRIWTTTAYVSEERRVQYVGGLGRSPIADNGLIEVDDGDRIRVTYTDPADPADVATTSAGVSCEPLLAPAFVLLVAENATQRLVSGGCDLGRAVHLRGDFFLDAGERLQYLVAFSNHTNGTIENLRATLECRNPEGREAADPCRYVGVLDPVQQVGRLPFRQTGTAVWNLRIDEGVTTLATADRVVEMEVTFEGSGTDFGARLASQRFVFREALHADNERLFYSTDHPYGGGAIVDYNRNGLIERAEVLDREELTKRGPREEREVRAYESWEGTSNAALLTACGGAPCVPFRFDENDGAFTTFLAPDSKPGPGYPTATQGWFWGTGGGCGWQTQGATGGPAAPKGVWHAGQGPIGVHGQGCGSYVGPTDTATLEGYEFVNFILRSPVFRKVNTGTDARGFEFDVRMESLSWNANERFGRDVNLMVEIDANIDDDGPAILGDSYTYRPLGEWWGPTRNAGDPNGPAHRFGPLFDPDGSLAAAQGPTGDEVGVAAPLEAYDAGDFHERALMPYPAVDADPNDLIFTSDERISTGPAGPCPSVPLGDPCRAGGFTTPAGPVRSRDLDTKASYEDFYGASGERFQFEFNWKVIESDEAGPYEGYTLDDVVFEWSEQHPADQPVSIAGADCSLDNLAGFTCTANTCGGGSPRDGLFCSTVEDCREVAVEGTCTGGACTTGFVGRSCAVDNECDLGRCVGGNRDLGCAQDADCARATNDCDAIPFRLSPMSDRGAAYTARQCAVISYETAYIYDCTNSFRVTVQDETPAVAAVLPGTCDAGAGTCTAGHTGRACAGDTECDVRRIEVRARSVEEPLGERFLLDETASGSGTFAAEVPITTAGDQEGILFVRANPTYMTDEDKVIVSYDDPECDLDSDGRVAESDFTDIDGDGIPNFGADGIHGDKDPVRTYVTGGPVSDDDSCFDALVPADVPNPAGVAQLDTNGDGLVDAADCVVDPDHNATGQCDYDSDGVGDICDNCPFVANADQYDADKDGIGNACEVTDVDGDGVEDVSDNCPTVYNPSQGQSGGGGPAARGELCDTTNDIDGDDVPEAFDNCPNEQLVESGGGGYLPGPCPGGALECTYNPDQVDSDHDGVGDACDAEDFDADGVQNALDNCPTLYNPADPVLLAQADSDGDGRGDDRAGTDIVGTCVGGPEPGVLCLPVGTGATCGAGGFCVAAAEAYCDPDSPDDNDDGVPDDLVQFTGRIECNYVRREEARVGPPSEEIGLIRLTSALITDDGTADFICVGGDPEPGNDPVIVEDCPVTDPALLAACIGVTTAAADASCDTPGGPGGDGNCEPVPDGIPDPAEVTSVQLTVVNQSVDEFATPRAIENATVGIRTVSPAVGCVTQGQIFVGSIPAGGDMTTPPGALQFILDPLAGQSAPGFFTEAEFSVSVTGDRIQGIATVPTFKLFGDADIVITDQYFQQIPPACGTSASGSSLGPAHASAGVLCEDFDTDRNGSGAFEFTRLFPAADPNDPLAGVVDPDDDVLGHTVGGGSAPFGVAGRICSIDADYPAALSTCHVVPTENDWHLHSPYEGCDPTYSTSPQFASSCAPEPKAHSGFRSMHMGRHLNASDTLWDTYRWRQTAGFVLDPVNLGSGSTLEFWHIIQVCDDKCVGFPDTTTSAGGQVHISLLNEATQTFDRWRRLDAGANGYNSVPQDVGMLCEFDPGDDYLPPNDETMCTGTSLQWSDIGDVYGTDRTCQTDTDGNDPVDKDCGETPNRFVDAGCSWVADPSCGSFLENGSVGTGVWARSTFDLSAFAGRRARLRWIFQGGGGWAFGQSRSWLEPQSGVGTFAYDQDDGWYIDDIRLTDLREAPAIIVPDPLDGFASCSAQGDGANCGRIGITIAGSTTDARTGGTILFAPHAGTGTPVVLDARQSAAGDDPNTPAIEGACDVGILEYRWSRIDTDPNGAQIATVLSPFSPAGFVTASPLRDTRYRVEVRCSSDPGCAASHDVHVLVYTGDGDDLATVLDEASATGVAGGLWIDHDPVAGEATLTWPARPQPPGVDGYDLFKGTLPGTSADFFAGDQFSGSPFDPDGAGTAYASSCNLPSGAAGDELSVTDVTPPPVGQASLYMIGHSSTNALAIAPLGRRPAVSSRSGTLVSASVICP